MVVCAGWNAEANATTSMKESFCAKQLALCKTTIDLIRWAKMNSGCQFQYDIALSSVPKVLYQTNKQDHEKLQHLNCAALPRDFERKFYDDRMCEEYILGKLGPRGLQHYRALVLAPHRADFFRYVLLFFEGGIYLDIKSCFVISLERILCACEPCSFLTCIGAGDRHIHQGILMCPAGHPLLHGAIHKVMETPPCSLGSRSPSYMTFCQQMWDMLQNQAGGNLRPGRNVISGWGSVWLMREQKTSKRTIDIRGQSIRIDGYLAFMQGLRSPVVAIRCEGWKHGFKDAPDMSQIDAIAEMNASAVVNDARTGVIAMDTATVRLANEAAIAGVMQRFSSNYGSLTAEELRDFTLQGLIATGDGWLGCQHHRTQGRPKMFAVALCLDHYCVCSLCVG